MKGRNGERMSGKSDSLKRKVFSDRYNKIIFRLDSQGGIYLVGGYMRDLLINRKCYDRDYVVEGPFEKRVRQIADATGGRVVSIGKKGLSRIIVGDDIALDFSPVRGNIEHDLSKRDFTINAIAWSPGTGMIDSCGGIPDLSTKMIRMVNADNLEEDPVRNIRAYRLAGELCFGIEPATRTALKSRSGLLSRSKTERITLEFFRILDLDNAPEILGMMLKDGLLTNIICNNTSKLQDLIKVLSVINITIEKLPLKYKKWTRRVFSQNLSCSGLLKLTVLLSGVPLNRLCLSSKIRRYLKLMQRGTDYYRKNHRLSKAYLFDLFEITRDASIGFLIVNRLTEHIVDYEHYQEIVLQRLISPDRIREISGLSGGMRLGGLIYGLRKAVFTGQVRSRADAVHVLRSSISEEKGHAGRQQERREGKPL
jgi:tRNA nucleotidyltransferase/poly(A) polymerase